MKILGEKIGFADKKTAEILFIVILSTFLLLFLYHNDCWRPVRYWLFLNGLILFVIPLLSFVFLGKKRNIFLLLFSAIFITGILLFLIRVSTTRTLYAVVKNPQFVYPFSLFFVGIIALILILGKVDVRSFGITFGKIKFWLPVLLIFILCMIPIIFWASKMPSFQKTYPMLPIAKKGIQGFVIAELSFGIFFVFWEFFFRGYMLFSLEKRVGFLVANCIQASAFAFMHLGKPELEVYSALAGGLIIGWLCYRSKTFLPAFLIHWVIQFSMDLFSVLK